MRSFSARLGAAALAAIVASMVAVAPADAAGFSLTSPLRAMQAKAGTQAALVHCRRWRHCHWWGCHRCGW